MVHSTQEVLTTPIISDLDNQFHLQSLDLIESDFKAVEESKPLINVIGSPITALPFAAQIELILKWAKRRESKIVCVANVHMLMEAYWHPTFSAVLKSADLVTPDGMPLVWMMRRMGAPEQNRVAGMEILMSLCQLAPQRNISIFFLGSEKRVLDRIRNKLEQQFPNLQIAGMEPLPFRPLTPAENDAIIQKIHESKAGLVLVALGCPKQENWMHQNKGKIQAVMIGLGGVFPIVAGIYKRAPLWMQNLGLEWFYRLSQDPHRLLGRYFKTNPAFILLALRQLLSQQLSINRATRI